MTSNNTISNNTISNSNLTGISSSSSSYNVINNNTILNNRVGIEVWGDSRRNIIFDNEIHSNTWFGIYLRSGFGGSPSNNTISGNVVHTNGQFGIYLASTSFNNLSDNEVYLNSDAGIRIEGGSNNSIFKNNVSNNIFEGIHVSSTNNTIVGNNVTSNGVEGLKISDTNTIMDNNISGSMTGIDIGSRNSKIGGNKISNTEFGIYLRGGIIYEFPNDIFDNNISENDFGIYIWTGSANMIWNNTFFSNNICGVTVTPSPFPGFKNRIYNNNFIGNTLHAFDDSKLNFWNDSYPSGGNYWDNWTLPDTMKGQNQNIPGSDGIVDAPHPFDGHNLDYFPLTKLHSPGPPPLPPTNLSAKLSGLNNENVTLSWNLSGDDGAGDNDVIGYAILISSNYNSGGRGYEYVDFVIEGINSYVHPKSGEGDPKCYFYFVEAWALDRARNGSEDQAAKYTRALTAGKHMVSMPLILDDTDISSVLQTVEFNIAWYYNNSDAVDPWKSYNPLKPFNDLTTVNHTMALGLIVKKKCNFTVAGIVPDTTEIRLKQGWNFVGYPSFIERNVSDALSGMNVQRIEGYSPLPPQNRQLLSPSSMMGPGYGYWIKVSSDTVWALEN
jgi:parallel beta-helix repeat protein